MRVRAMQYPFVCPGDSGEKNIACRDHRRARRRRMKNCFGVDWAAGDPMRGGDGRRMRADLTGGSVCRMARPIMFWA